LSAAIVDKQSAEMVGHAGGQTVVRADETLTVESVKGLKVVVVDLLWAQGQPE